MHNIQIKQVSLNRGMELSILTPALIQSSKYSNGILYFSCVLLFITLNSCGSINLKDEDMETKPISSCELSIPADVNQTKSYEMGACYQGNIVLPGNAISLIISANSSSGSKPGFSSLKSPEGTQVLDTLGEFAWRDFGYGNLLIPMSSSYSASSGTWIYESYSATSHQVTVRTGSVSSTPTITVKPYITGTAFNAAGISVALDNMKAIYLQNGVNLIVESTETVSDSQYTNVSSNFNNSVTSALVSRSDESKVNLFFIEDYSDVNYLGNAAGIPGSQGIAGSRNGVLISLNAHLIGGSLDTKLLGETAGHEMGHFLGLFHPTERGGTLFDPLGDTPECANSYDSNSDGKMTAEECENKGGNNLMFWTSYSTSSRNSGKKQDNISEDQVYVIKYAPIAK